MSQKSREARRLAKQMAEQSANAIPAAPEGFIQGFSAPWRLFRVVSDRPFAWIKPCLAALVVFMPLISLIAEAIISIGMPNAGSFVELRARQLFTDLIFWVFAPLLLVIFLAGALRFLGNGRLTYSLVLEPLKTRIGSLFVVGIASLVMAFGLKALGGFVPNFGQAVAGSLMLLLWNPILLLSTTHIWSEEQGPNSLWWAIKKAWKQKTTWLGIGVFYVIFGIIAVAVTLGITMLILQIPVGQGVKAVFSMITILIFAVFATLLTGLNGVMALVMHKKAMTTT